MGKRTLAVACGSLNKPASILIIDLLGQQVTGRLVDHHVNIIDSMRFVGNNLRWLVSVGRDNVFYVWKVLGNHVVQHLGPVENKHTDFVRSMIATSGPGIDGKSAVLIVTAAEDKTVRFYVAGDDRYLSQQ